MVLLPELEKKGQSPGMTVRLTMVNITSLAQGSLKTLLNWQLLKIPCPESSGLEGAPEGATRGSSRRQTTGQSGECQGPSSYVDQLARAHVVSPVLILKEINPEYSLEGLMLRLKPQYFGHMI